jgi:thioesterase domain-containing protein
VYGIESPGLHDGTRPLRRFEDIAAHHIEVMRRVQPEGPYLLGGWSFGAMVSHEMAYQLEAAGEAVDTIIGLDGYLRDSRGRPVGADPATLSRCLWYMLQARLGDLRLPSAAAAQQPGAGRVSRIMEVGRVMGGRRDEPDYAAVHNASITALLRYVPRPVPCSIVVFKTGLTAAMHRRIGERIAPLYRGGVEVLPAYGNHWTVLDAPQAKQLGPELRQVLDRLGSTTPMRY